MNVSDALSLDQTKHNQNPGITASSIPDAESKAESTIRVCLDRIEQALRKIEQETAPENGSLRVGIELEKKIGKTEPDGPVRPSPWAVLAIAPSVIARESGSKPFQKAVRETSASYQEPEEVVANHEAVEEEVVIIKCICACADDDGHTVFCEKCETWQHVACYFPDGRIPDEHYCTDCSPHTIDTEAGSERHQHGSKAGESHSAVKAYTSWGSSQRSTEDWVRWNSSTGRQSAAQPQEGFQKDTNNSKYYYKALEAYEAYEEQLKEMEALHWKRMGRPEGWTPDMHGPNKELEIFKKFGNEDKASREHMKYIAPRMHRMTDEQHEWKEQHASPPPPRSFEPDFGGRSSKARKATVRLSTYSPPEHR